MKVVVPGKKVPGKTAFLQVRRVLGLRAVLQGRRFRPGSMVVEARVLVSGRWVAVPAIKKVLR